MNRRNRPRQALPLRRKPIWHDVDYQELTRNAERHVSDYMKTRGWADADSMSLKTEDDRLYLLENLPSNGRTSCTAVSAALPGGYYRPTLAGRVPAEERALAHVDGPPSHGR